MEFSEYNSLRAETKDAVSCEDESQHYSLSLSDLHDEIMLELHGEKVDRSSNVQEVHVEPWSSLWQKKVPEFSSKREQQIDSFGCYWHLNARNSQTSTSNCGQ